MIYDAVMKTKTDNIHTTYIYNVNIIAFYYQQYLPANNTESINRTAIFDQ